ncbi:peptidylprolyl isomerase [Lacinutrix salivirga]
MAILNKIRQKTVVLILVIALALFAFILSSLFDNKDALFNKSQDIVATVNGKDINRVDFMNRVENMQRQQQGRATNTQVMNSVFEQEVQSIILNDQYEALGLSVEQDQMRDILKQSLATMPDFLNEAGVFDENKLNEFIANLKAISPEFGFLNGQPINYQAWVNYENSVAANYLRQNYLNMVKAGTTATIAEGEMDYKLANDKVDFKYVQIPFSSIPDSTITVSKSEIKAYIEDHKSQYEVEASRSINFVEFKEVASVEDENAIKAELNGFLNGTTEYNENTKLTDSVKPFSKITDNEAFINANSDLKFEDRFVNKNQLPKDVADKLYSLNVGETFGPYKDNGYYKISKVIAESKMPDSVKARHILIPFEGSRSATEGALTKEAAKQQADSLLAVFKRSKSTFADVAKTMSSDKGSGAKGGDLGYFTYGAMVPEFNNFSFENNTGDLGVVETAFGYHIIDIEDQKNKQRVIKVGTIARKIEPSDATNDKIFRDASNFELAVSEKDFLETAKENNYTARPLKSIKALDENIPGLGNQRAIVRWTFEEDSKVGDVKRFNVPGGYAIVQLTAKNNKGLMNVEDASVTALPEIRKQKKAKLIKDRVSATNLQDLANAEKQTIKTALAVNMKNPTVSGAGREPMVVGTAFGLKEGATSGLITGNNGVYMVETTKITPAPELDNYQAFANQVSQQKSNAVNAKLFAALKESAEIEDNRANTVQ